MASQKEEQFDQGDQDSALNTCQAQRGAMPDHVSTIQINLSLPSIPALEKPQMAPAGVGREGKKEPNMDLLFVCFRFLT